jgi:integrase
MAHSKPKSKPDKPRPDFPLFCHKARGWWVKKVRGKLHYFTKKADDPKGESALTKWLDQKDDLLAGRTPRTKENSLGVADLVNHFLTHKKRLIENGELAQRTFDRYFATGGLLVSFFGRNRLVEDLAADDFQMLRAKMAKRWGPISLGNEIQIVRSIFRYGHEADLLEKPVRFGLSFKKPSAKTIRAARAAKGPKMYTREQIRSLLQAGSANMAAMILLGVNCGLGNTDLGMLPVTAFDLEGGWLDYPRQKTGIARRIPLWPETIAVVRTALEKRPQPSDTVDKKLLFIGARGESYTGEHKGYRVAQEFAHLLTDVGIEGRTFYDLRRTFQTIGEGAHDLVAVQSIMGHAPASGDMSSIYRQKVEDERLLAVTEHVRNWLYAEPAGTSKQPTRKGKSTAKQKPQQAKPVARTQQVSANDRPHFRIVG